MVIAKPEWFQGKKGSYLERYDVTWQGAIYFAVMFGFPLILGVLFLPSFIIIVAGYYQNIDIVLISLAWFAFSLGDFMDSDIKYPQFKPLDEEDDDFSIAIRNSIWIISLILIISTSISIIYNIRSWNFYLGIFATIAFTICMILAVAKYRFEKKELK